MKCRAASHEKVSTLLGDPQNLWTFGDRRRDLEVMCNQVKEGEIVTVRKTVIRLVSWFEKLYMISSIVAIYLKLLEFPYRLNYRRSIMHLLIWYQD